MKIIRKTYFLILILITISCNTDRDIDSWSSDCSDYKFWNRMPDSTWRVLSSEEFNTFKYILDTNKIVKLENNHPLNDSLSNFCHLVRAVYYSSKKIGFELYTRDDSLLVLHSSLSVRGTQMERTAVVVKLENTPKYIFTNAVTDE